MTRPIKTVVDCATGIQSEVELTDEEILEQQEREARAAEHFAQQEAEAQAKAEAKASAAAKLAALGLTADEIAALS